MIQVVRRTLTKHQTRNKTLRENKERAIVCGHHLQNHFPFGRCPLLLPLQCIHNYFCFVTGQIDIDLVLYCDNYVFTLSIFGWFVYLNSYLFIVYLCMCLFKLLFVCLFAQDILTLTVISNNTLQ